ncbi:hypothetical protein [Halocatena halophila]|uniref:hypothetical protein n=1 Tax=Halocatena halophila TaxID=2814576 RepID=UPI002ED2CCCB
MRASTRGWVNQHTPDGPHGLSRTSTDRWERTLNCSQYNQLPVNSDGSSLAIQLADTTARIVNTVGGWMLVLIGGLGLLSAVGHAIQRPAAFGITLLMGLVWVLLVTVGLVVTPRGRERLARRGNPSEFGTAHRVDERTIRTDRSFQCVSCDTDRHQGLERRFTEAFVVAGVRMATLSETANYYCPTCALSERTVRSDDSTAPERTREY